MGIARYARPYGTACGVRSQVRDRTPVSGLLIPIKRSENFELAGRWGFEPQIETSPITDFESAAFDHSAIFPYSLSICYMNSLRDFNRFVRFALSGSRFAFSHPLGSMTSLSLIIHSVLFPYSLSICRASNQTRQI